MAKSNRQTFAAPIADWVKKVEGAQLAVFKQSSQEVIELMQKPRGKGGRMRVDTGFLRSSLKVTIDSPYQGFIQRNSDYDYEWNDAEVSLTINGAQISQTIYAVYAASYAAPREYGARGQAGDFFVRGAAQKWQSIVNENVRKLRVR